MVVQHNLTAMNSNRMLGITTGQQAKSSEKLSSGYRINRAADDAAGLTISEKMRKQMRGLDRAATNAQDGISCVQTAEGALTEVHSMLQRMNELAVQAANGTMSKDDRQATQDEIDQLVTEIDRVAETTKFNEIYLLKGGEGTKTETRTVGAASVSPAYLDTISQEKTLSFKTGGTNIWATKDGVSKQVDDTNYKDIFELGKTTVTKTQDAADKATAGAGKDYEITDGTLAKGGSMNGAVTVTIADQDKFNAGFAANTTLKYDGTDWKDANGKTVTLADYGITVTDAGGNLAANDTIDITAATVTHTNDVFAENGTTALTDAEIIAADAASKTLYTKAAETEEVEGIVTKPGYQIYKVAPDEATDFGDQLEAQKATYAEIESNFDIKSDLLLDKDGNAVSEDKLAEHFDENGLYKNDLYKEDPANAGALLEVGAEQLDDYVNVNRTEAETKEVEVAEALEFKLHVGSESADNNKIGVTIESMSAVGIGVDVLEKKGLMTQKDATSAIDTISNAIAKVSKQRSALGAIQNRLEHTIANLDNIVENTTAAESRIRDTDMAEEMVEYSKNNILAQAGQSMLAQANQSNQGVLSLLQ